MTTENRASRLLHISWPTSLAEAGLVLVISLVAGIGWWLLSADRLPLSAEATVYELELEAPLLSLEEALAAYELGEALFIDTRVNPAETIPGAFFVREESFDDDLLAQFDFMFPEDELILFGDGNLTAASNLAGRLAERGFTKVTILKGGLTAWRNAAGEVSVNSERTAP